MVDEPEQSWTLYGPNSDGHVYIEFDGESLRRVDRDGPRETVLELDPDEYVREHPTSEISRWLIERGVANDPAGR